MLGGSYQARSCAIDEIHELNLRHFPDRLSLEKAYLHPEVFQRLFTNPIFPNNPVQAMNFIRITKPGN